MMTISNPITRTAGMLTLAAGLAFSPLGANDAKAQYSSFSTTSTMNTMNTMNTMTTIMMTIIILDALDQAETQMSVEDALKGPISNMRECALENNIDIESIIEKGMDSGVTDPSKLSARDIGLSDSEARKLGDCTKEYRALDKLVGGFSVAYDLPDNEGYDALVGYAGDHVTFGAEDYEYCMAEGGMRDAFSLGSTAGFAISREDVDAFKGCAEDYQSPTEIAEAEKRKQILFGGLLFGGLVIGAFGLLASVGSGRPTRKIQQPKRSPYGSGRRDF